ncbi:MAG: class I SAM-dependent methyltransferase [Acinetobacter sp.]
MASKYIGNQEDRSFWSEIKKHHGSFDIILDDGGHTMRQQINTFEEMFPTLSDGGIYICEDTHTSYMPSFGGGLRKAGTFHEYIKDAIDKMHGWYYQSVEDTKANYFCNNVHSIRIYDSLVVIEKRKKNSPFSMALGKNGHVKLRKFSDVSHLLASHKT